MNKKYSKILKKALEIGGTIKDISIDDTVLRLAITSEELNKRIWLVNEFGKFHISYEDIKDNSLPRESARIIYVKTQKAMLETIDRLFKIS